LTSTELEKGEDGKLRTGRVWNGDQIKGGEAMIMPNDEPDYHEVPIPACTPARTGLAVVEVYTLQDTP
jgi:hypothetical protein